jgi:hypothetical protein
MQVEKKGVIYFEDYCKLMLRKYREEDELEFIRIMFKVTLPDHVIVIVKLFYDKINIKYTIKFCACSC